MKNVSYYEKSLGAEECSASYDLKYTINIVKAFNIVFVPFGILSIECI